MDPPEPLVLLTCSMPKGFALYPEKFLAKLLLSLLDQI